MTRLLTTGFEVPTLSGWNYGQIGYGTFYFDNSKYRGGAYSLKVDYTGYNARTIWATLPGTNTELYVRLHFMTNTISDLYKRLLTLSTDVTTDLIAIRAVNANRKMYVSVNGTDRILSQVLIDINTWYLVELHVVLSDTGQVELRIDGIDQGSWSGDTKPGADTTFNKIEIGHFDASGGLYWFDDLAVNNGDGTTDNSWIGESFINAIRPNAAGDTTEWDPNTGSNYQCVDETTPDNDTSYVSTDVVGEVDLYNASTYTLPSGATVRRVWVEAVAMQTTTGTDKLQLGVKAGATTDWDTAGEVSLTTSYAKYKSKEWTVNPDDGAAWEQADIDSLQLGIKAT